MLSDLDPDLSRADEGREPLLIFVSVCALITDFMVHGDSAEGRAAKCSHRDYISLAAAPIQFPSRLYKSPKYTQRLHKMGDSQLFAATFAVSDINPDKYDRVARVFANSEDGETCMHLDINTDLFSCAVLDRLHILLSSTLSLDGVKDDVKGGWRELRSGEGLSLADEYDYVCHGKIYRFEEDQGNMYVEYHELKEQFGRIK